MESVSPELVVAANFNDVGSFSRAIDWDLDFRQLEPGPLDVNAQVVAADRCMWLSFEFSRSFHQVGSPPGDYMTFGIPSERTGDFRWCGRSARGGTLLNFNLSNGFDSVSGSGFSGHTFSFQRDRLMELAEIAGLTQSVDELVGRDSIWEMPAVASLCRRLQSLSEGLPNENQLLGEFGELINDDIGLTVLESVSRGLPKSGEGTASQRARVLRQALEIIRERDHMPLAVTTLAKATNTSLSTLRRAFTDEFGVNPKVYIRMRCLSGARDELANSPPGASVSRIANRWGFWHMGYFARDYRRMFGLLPSEQLPRQG